MNPQLGRRKSNPSPIAFSQTKYDKHTPEKRRSDEAFASCNAGSDNLSWTETSDPQQRGQYGTTLYRSFDAGASADLASCLRRKGDGRSGQATEHAGRARCKS